MAAPVLPGGRGGSPAGGPAPPLPPPDPMGPVGPAGPPGPPGPLPAGAALLAQMVAAMQATAAGITSPRPRRSSTTLAWSENIPPPIFKGLLGERPEAHLLRANDWMDIYNILPANKPANFKHTLDHLAREWYDSLMLPIA